jgi:hypothetical protein
MNDFLMSIAPTIASALLGPVGGLAVAGLGKIFGIDGATQADITKTITEGKITPDQIAEIKKMELEYQDHEKERGFKYSELEFKDRDSARTMQSATQSNTPSVLTYLITIGFFGILGWMLYDDSVVNSPPLLIMLGSLGTAWTGACAFWFGTTQGAQNKDRLLAQSTPIKASN